MDEVTVEGRIFISSKRAAALTGYAKDYVGQLCREGRIEARLIGRGWYVYEPSIMKHRFEEGDGGDTEENVPVVSNISDIAVGDTRWEKSTYTPEEVQTIPEIDPEVLAHMEPKVEAIPEQMTGIKNQWEDWFQTGTPTTPKSVHIKEELPIVEPHFRDMVQEYAPQPSPKVEEEPYEAPVRESVPELVHIVRDSSPHINYSGNSFSTRENTPEEVVVPTGEYYYEEQASVNAFFMRGPVIKAVLVGTMVVMISLTVLSLGGSGLRGSASSSPFYKYITGETVVK